MLTPRVTPVSYPKAGIEIVNLDCVDGGFYIDIGQTNWGQNVKESSDYCDVALLYLWETTEKKVSDDEALMALMSSVDGHWWMGDGSRVCKIPICKNS